MQLNAQFYHDLFNKRSQQTPPLIVKEGWASSNSLMELVKRLQEDASARHVFIIERSGKDSVSYGDLGHIHTTDLISLIIGKTLACDALANLVNGNNFSALSVEGKRWGAHMSALGEKAILIVIFDQQTNIDRVGLRVRRAAKELVEILSLVNQLT